MEYFKQKMESKDGRFLFFLKPTDEERNGWF